MYKLNVAKVSKTLHKLNINELAKDKKFNMRSKFKICPLVFMLSFFEQMLSKCYSLRLWSFSLSMMIEETVSFQAIAKKLQFRQLNFVKALVGAALTKLGQESYRLSSTAPFNRILIEDSTCFDLPDGLSQFFPGASNQYGPDKATARIQLRIDLLGGKYENMEIQSFRDHDATYADHILEGLGEKDLVLRDLGYHVGRVLKSIVEKGAHFVGRYKPRVSIYDIENEELIDLYEELKGLDRKGLHCLDRKVKIGKERLPVRLICFKLDQKNKQKRLRKATKNGNRNKQLSAKTIYLYGWNIFITSVEQQECEAQDIYRLYGFRWHIELIFKIWKSHIKLKQVIQSCQGPNPVKPQILALLCLCFIIIVINPQIRFFTTLLLKKYGKILSPMKFVRTFLNHAAVLHDQTQDKILLLLSKICCYDKRKDRKNIYEQLITIF